MNDYEIADRARHFVAAERGVAGAATGVDLVDALGKRDLAYHDLLLACGYSCECDLGTCPGAQEELPFANGVWYPLGAAVPVDARYL